MSLVSFYAYGVIMNLLIMIVQSETVSLLLSMATSHSPTTVYFAHTTQLGKNNNVFRYKGMWVSLPHILLTYVYIVTTDFLHTTPDT